MTTVSSPILETPRLVLRELVPEDSEALHAVIGDPVSMRFYPAPFDREAAAQWIHKARERYVRDGHSLWAVLLRESGEFIGDCGPMIQSVEGIEELEVGYHIRRDFQRRGYATEAARACRDWAFDNRAVERVISLIRPRKHTQCRRCPQERHAHRQAHQLARTRTRRVGHHPT